MLLIFLKNQCVMGCPPGVKGRRLEDPPVVWLKGQPDPLEGPHPLPRMSLPSLAACSPPRLIAEVELERAGVQVGGGMQSWGEATQNVIGIIWTYLHELMGGGVPCIGRWILNHWITREVPHPHLFFIMRIILDHPSGKHINTIFS